MYHNILTQRGAHFLMRRSISSFMTNVTHEILGAHFLWKTAHQISSRGNAFPFSPIGTMESWFMYRTRTSNITSAVIPVEQTGWNDFLEFVLPHWRAIYVFQVYALTILIFVTVLILKELFGERSHMVQVMANS